MKLFNFFKPTEFALVGKDIKWKEIEREVCRINDFDRNDTTIDNNGQAIAKSNFRPYGFLVTDWPVIERKVKIPIVHRDDFLLAASIFDNSEFLNQIKGCDILVTYYPLDTKADKRSAFLHKLHFVVTPPNTLEKYYEIRSKSFLGLDPEILFGDFIWIGELNVKINSNPQFE